MTKDEVNQKVTHYLDANQPESYRLTVDGDLTRQDDEWWYVVVVPDQRDVDAYRYYGNLANAEQQLQESEQLDVLLVPALPEDD